MGLDIVWHVGYCNRDMIYSYCLSLVLKGCYNRNLPDCSLCKYFAKAPIAKTHREIMNTIEISRYCISEAANMVIFDVVCIAQAYVSPVLCHNETHVL